MDLTKQQPRPGSEKLGEWAWLPRMIDKARAKYQGNIGEYAHPCGRDRMLLAELGISAEEFREVIENTETDAEVLRALEDRRAAAEADS
ncbi:MAG: hypothetical protein Kow00129_04100 [Thermoleophilia bacterium]